MVYCSMWLHDDCDRDNCSPQMGVPSTENDKTALPLAGRSHPARSPLLQLCMVKVLVGLRCGSC